MQQLYLAGTACFLAQTYAQPAVNHSSIASRLTRLIARLTCVCAIKHSLASSFRFVDYFEECADSPANISTYSADLSVVPRLVSTFSIRVASTVSRILMNAHEFFEPKLQFQLARRDELRRRVNFQVRSILQASVVTHCRIIYPGYHVVC